MSEAFENCDECPNEITCALNEECARAADFRFFRGLKFGVLFSLPLWAIVGLLYAFAR